MISYPYIVELFKAIFAQSKIVSGRFHVVPFFGNDLNDYSLGDVVNALPKEQKYPCVLLFPPAASGTYQLRNNGERETYDLTMVFLCQAKVTGQGAISKPAVNLQSQHKTYEAWHDMRRVAVNFLQVLWETMFNSTYLGDINLLKTKQVIRPVTDIGNDKATGVVLSNLQLSVNMTCDIDDYPEDFTDLISVPVLTDPHPLHLDI